MVKKSVLLKPGARNVKSVKKSSLGGVKKAKTVSVKPTTKPEKKKKTAVVKAPEEKFSEEIEELEGKFHIETATVKKAVDGIIKLTVENDKLKNKLFDEQFPIFLQINTFKVPNIHAKIVRIPLQHSILTLDSDICLIVPDVQGIPNKNHEEHLEHYEKLLQRKDVHNIKKIMTFHELRTEYETFELKRRLVELYDFFLVDGRISGKTVKKCGKIFYTKRKVPTAIKLQATKLKEHIDQALKKTVLYLHGKSDSFMVQIGHNLMKNKQIVENLFDLLKGLEKQFPAGFANVRSLNLATFTGITIPIYVSLKNATRLVIPREAKKPNGVETVVGEITTRPTSGVVVKPTGEVKVFPLKKKKGSKKGQGNKKEPQNEVLKEKKSGKRKLENTPEVTNNTIKKKRKENSVQVTLKKSKAINKKKNLKKKSRK